MHPKLTPKSSGAVVTGTPFDTTVPAKAHGITIEWGTAAGTVALTDNGVLKAEIKHAAVAAAGDVTETHTLYRTMFSTSCVVTVTGAGVKAFLYYEP
jgi:hypothetical protein